MIINLKRSIERSGIPSLLLVLFVSSYLTLVANTSSGQSVIIPNGGFEVWDTLPGFGFLPHGWTGGDIEDSLNTVFQSTDAHSGSFALGERVVYAPSNRATPTLETADTIINGEPDPFIGFPIVGNPTSFEGWYKFNSVGNDFFVITLGFQNSFTNTGIAYFSDTASKTSYTHFSVPFIVPVTDSGMGTIEIVVHGTHLGTVLRVDDLGITSAASNVSITNSTFGLEPNFPNPFSSLTTIRYSLPTEDHIKLELLDILGQRLALLEDQDETQGEHQICFNGEGLASGPYVCRLTAVSNGVSSYIIQLSH